MCKIQGKTVCTCGLTEVGNGSSPNNGNGRSGKALGKSNLYGGSSAWTSPSTIPGGGAADKPRVTSLPLDLASPVTPDPAAPVTRAPEPRDPADVLGSPTSGVNSDSATDAANRNGEQDARRTPEKDSILTASHLPPSVPHSAHRKRKEHADGKEGGEHDPKVIRSTKEVVGDLDSIRPKMPAYNKDFLSSPADSLESPDDDFPSLLDDDDEPATQSPEESSCVSAQDNWETGGDSETRETQGDEDHDTHEERRLKERSFPRVFPQSSRRTRRRTKKRHHSHSPQVRRK